MRKTLPFVVAIATIAATLPGAAQATSTTCATSTVCAEYINSYSGTSGGVAIHGEANSGIGVRGTSVTNTGFYGASGSGLMTAPGVEGEATNDTNVSTAGGFGLVAAAGGSAPEYGVMAYGNTNGLYGETVTASGGDSSFAGYGVEGNDPRSSVEDFDAGVFGHTTYGVGVLAEAGGTPAAGLIGNGFAIGSYAVADQANGLAVGIESESNAYPLEVRNTQANFVAQLATGAYLVNAYAGSEGSGGFFYVNGAGSAHLSGTLTTLKGTYARTRGRSGRSRMAYGARTTSPVIEDFGGGQLEGGRAVVSLDGAFADTIDPHRPYRIFLTPQGDCNGLYVAQKNAGSFVVRELRGGRSSIAFDYRIIAKPADEDGSRLAEAPIDAPAERALPSSPQRLPAPLSPTDRLRARLGPQGYARALAAIRERLRER